MSNDHATPADLRGVPRSSYARSHAVPETCEWCYSDLDPTTGDCENGCDDWDRYWRSLTPAAQAAELAMMDAHCAEQTGE